MTRDLEMTSAVQGNELREETLGRLTCTSSLDVPQNVTEMGWRQESMCLTTHRTVPGVKKQSQKPRGVVREHNGQTGTSLKPGKS